MLCKALGFCWDFCPHFLARVGWSEAGQREQVLPEFENPGASQVFTQPGCTHSLWHMRRSCASCDDLQYEVFCTTWAGKPSTLLAVSHQLSVEAFQNRGEMALDVFSVWKLGITTFKVMEWYSVKGCEVVSGLTGLLAAVLNEKGEGFLFCCWVYTIPLPRTVELSRTEIII